MCHSKMFLSEISMILNRVIAKRNELKGYTLRPTGLYMYTMSSSLVYPVQSSPVYPVQLNSPSLASKLSLGH